MENWDREENVLDPLKTNYSQKNEEKKNWEMIGKQENVMRKSGKSWFQNRANYVGLTVIWIVSGQKGENMMVKKVVMKSRFVECEEEQILL